MLTQKLCFDIVELCEQCHVDDSTKFINRCRLLFSLIKDTNKSFNLTRILDSDGFWIKHVADCLLIGKYFPIISSAKLTVADIGCGAGFPSLILASAYPKLEVTAVDSVKKKTDFVSYATGKLGVRLHVEKRRAREMNRLDRWRTYFDVITARAVADASVLFRESGNMLKKDGQIILYKTPGQVDSELSAANKATQKHCFRWYTSPVFDLPKNMGNRMFIHGESVQQ